MADYDKGLWNYHLTRRFAPYLKEMTVIWNCDEEKAKRLLCQAYYLVARGMRPKAAAATIDRLTSTVRCYR